MLVRQVEVAQPRHRDIKFDRVDIAPENTFFLAILENVPENLRKPIIQRPDDWRFGDVLAAMQVLGVEHDDDIRLVHKCLKRGLAQLCHRLDRVESGE